MRIGVLWSTVLLCGLAPADAARAQEAVEADTSRTAAISLFASVSAREVRFAKQPTIRVLLMNGAVDTVRVIERRNLPDPVQAGVTYRDVYIAVEILGRVNAECLASRITRQNLPPACASAARDTSAIRTP